MRRAWLIEPLTATRTLFATCGVPGTDPRRSAECASIIELRASATILPALDPLRRTLQSIAIAKEACPIEFDISTVELHRTTDRGGPCEIEIGGSHPRIAESVSDPGATKQTRDDESKRAPSCLLRRSTRAGERLLELDGTVCASPKQRPIEDHPRADQVSESLVQENRISSANVLDEIAAHHNWIDVERAGIGLGADAAAKTSAVDLPGRTLGVGQQHVAVLEALQRKKRRPGIVLSLNRFGFAKRVLSLSHRPGLSQCVA